MAQEDNNDNDEYYVPKQIISGGGIVKPNLFGQADAIALGILTCKWNSFLQTPWRDSIETIKNELANLSIFKATMDHMDLISHNFYD